MQLDAIRAALERIISNSYIATADEATISSLETFLGITPALDQPLEERRQVLAVSFNGSSSHIGAPEIKKIAERFTDDGVISISFTNGIINLTIEKPYGSTCNYLSCYTILSNSIPAHLQLDMRVIALLQRKSMVYTGTAMRTLKTMSLKMESVDIQSLVTLTDELGDILVDERGYVILD